MFTGRRVRNERSLSPAGLAWRSANAGVTQATPASCCRRAQVWSPTQVLFLQLLEEILKFIFKQVLGPLEATKQLIIQ